MADQDYHAVFVGAGLISLTAAAALAKRGKRVLLLDTTRAHESDIHDAGFDFSSGPLLYLGYEKWGAMEGYFSQLAYPIPSLQKKGFSFQKVSPLLQLVSNKHRLSLFSDEEAYFDELKREFPKQAQKLKTLFDQMTREAAYFYPSLGQFQQLEVEGMAERLNQWKKQLDISQAILQQQKKKAFELIEPLNFKPNVLAYFKLLFLFAFKKPMREVSAFEMIQLFSGFQRGGVRMQDGDATLQHFFQGLIQTLGGKILKTPKISKYEVENKHVVQINLCDGSTLKADHFVVAAPPHRKTLNFYFSMPTKLIPSPMREALVMTWGEKPPKDFEDLIVLRLNQNTAPETSKTPAPSLIAVSILLRENASALDIDHEKLRESLLKRLHWLIPFSESEIKTLPSLEHHEITEEEISLPLGDITDGTKKEIAKGILNTLQPKGLKNVYWVKGHTSDYLGQGSAFLAGHHLAEFIEKSK
ncbi:hypothetical protein MNBD_NITROSPIRAE01-1876 [hydrothermal vent metagenome]|uniref:Uncharacterized protein n=1 Tax=hydrothermal vent metagenome TaxID=652676 RepID=A0A3B1D7D6_9ZZZZ